MKIVDALEKASAHVTTWPTGSKIDDTPKTTMVIESGCLGPATTAPPTSTPVGSIETHVIQPAPENPNREPNIWTDVPSWMVGERW